MRGVVGWWGRYVVHVVCAHKCLNLNINKNCLIILYTSNIFIFIFFVFILRYMDTFVFFHLVSCCSFLVLLYLPLTFPV